LVSVVTATGTINPVVAVQVGSQVTGRIDSLHADFNSVVKAGQVVARIDPQAYRARRDQAAAVLANAVAAKTKAATDLAQRKRELERAKSLVDQHFVSQNDVDVALTAYEGAKAQLEVADAQVQQARATLEAAELDLKYTVIRSPVSGTVIARNVEVGHTQMQVDTYVSEADIGGISPGKPVLFTVDAYPGEQFRGVVKQVRNAPVSVQNVVTYDVVVGVDNRDQRLKPGMTANVTIIIAQRDAVLAIPNGALRFTPPVMGRRGSGPAETGQKSRLTVGQKLVWKDTSGIPEGVPVRVGLSDGVNTELLDGNLTEGDAVIIGIETPRAQSKSSSLPPGFGGSRRPSRGL
jgi:HlyD family secretion protein